MKKVFIGCAALMMFLAVGSAIALYWFFGGDSSTSAISGLKRPVASIVGKELVDSDGKSVELLPSQFYLVYFSAHWCPPCRKFTPKLASFYKKVQRGNNFEVIFVSNDKDEAAMRNYMKSMPWPAVKYNGVAHRELSRGLAGSGIPNLLALDQNGNVIFSSYKDGRYVGPNSALSEFQKHLKSLPVITKPILDAKELSKIGTSNVKRIEMIVSGVEENKKTEPLKEKTKRVKAITGSSFKGYVLNGIAGGDSKRHAVINGKLYSVGDSLEPGIVIQEISSKEVRLSHAGKEVILKVYK